MFRPIRKVKNKISQEAAEKLLEECRRGTLAVNGDDGYPYAVPINYRFEKEENRILFHSAKGGYKAEALKASDKVCFTVCGNETIRDEAWAPYLQSAVVFGRCHPVENKEENLRLCKQFAMKYYPQETMVDEEIAMSGAAVQMYVIEIEHLSGKEVQER